MAKQRIKPNCRRRVLRLPDLDHSIDPRYCVPASNRLRQARSLSAKVLQAFSRAMQFRVPETVFDPVNAAAKTRLGVSIFVTVSNAVLGPSVQVVLWVDTLMLCKDLLTTSRVAASIAH